MAKKGGSRRCRKVGTANVCMRKVGKRKLFCKCPKGKRGKGKKR